MKTNSELLKELEQEIDILEGIMSRIGNHCNSPVDCGCSKEIDEYFKQKRIKNKMKEDLEYIKSVQKYIDDIKKELK